MKYRTFIYWGIGIFIVWLMSGYLMTCFWGTSGRGQAGDMFGAINSLFSGLAFAGIIFTIIIQREELKLQREELKLQREEVAKSTKELAGQKESMIIQRFENTFFNMISAHDTIVSSAYIDDTDPQGKALLDQYYEYIESYITHGESITDAMERYTPIIKNINLCYTNFVFILQYVANQASIDDSAKKNYVDILIAQLSRGQIGFYYCYAQMKEEKGDIRAQQELLLLNAYKINKFM